MQLRDLTLWERHIRATQAARAAADAIEDQAIRDAHASALSQERIAIARGTRSRGRIGRVLQGEAPAAPARPAPAAVYLRAPGFSDRLWARLDAAMWRRGWLTVHVRTDAWHLARGGLPVVAVDLQHFPGGVENPHISVVRVGAHYVGQHLELVPLTPGDGLHPRPYTTEAGATVVDVDAIARIVAIEFAQSAARLRVESFSERSR